MTLKAIARTAFALALFLVGLPQGARAAELASVAEPASKTEPEPFRHAIEVSPMSFLFKIYAVQYAYHFSPNNELITGLAFQNIEHPFGRTNSPTFIMGYRRYFWDKFSLEYQLWPAYNWYYYKGEQRFYNGPELWNEARAGYTFDFNVLNIPSYVSLQYLFGFGLWPGNKPTEFLEAEKKERFFHFPLLMLGTRF